MQAGAGRTATLFPLLLAGLLAGMTYWLEIASRPPAGARDGKSRHDPDYIVENFMVQRFGPEGNLQHTLRASAMRHYPDDDSTIVIAPGLTWHRRSVAHIVAHEAHLDKEGRHVQLIGDVRMVRAGTQGNPETVLSTARLDIWPDDEIASNSAPVTIIQGRSRIDGNGLRLDNKTATFTLLGPVNGLFHRAAALVANPLPVAPQAKSGPEAKPKTKPEAKSKAKSRTRPKPRPRKPQTKQTKAKR